MELLSFPVGVVQGYDFMIILAKVGPPGLHLNIGNKQELAVLVDRAFRDFITGTKGEFFAELLAGDVFPIAPHVDGFPLPRGLDVLAVFLRLVEPSILTLASEVPLNDEIAVIFHDDSHVVDGVVAGVQTNEEGFVRKLFAETYGLLQKLHGTVLAVLLPCAELEVNGVPPSLPIYAIIGA